MSKDLFEVLRENVGCDFISDIQFEPYRSKVISNLAVMDLSSYSLTVLNDIGSYLYKGFVPFNDISEAVGYLKHKGKKRKKWFKR